MRELNTHAHAHSHMHTYAEIISILCLELSQSEHTRTHVYPSPRSRKKQQGAPRSLHTSSFQPLVPCFLKVSILPLPQHTNKFCLFYSYLKVESLRICYFTWGFLQSRFSLGEPFMWLGVPLIHSWTVNVNIPTCSCPVYCCRRLSCFQFGIFWITL